MPRWFSSGRQCPLTAEQQEWVDRRWDWLCTQFGNTFPRDRPIILPTPEFFPDTSTETPDGIESLFKCVCRYMNIDPSTTKLTFFEAETVVLSNGSNADGLYLEIASGVFNIAIATRTLANPFNFVGTVAHELAHVHLLGHKRLTQDIEDHELVTDLLPIFFGAGIFGANAVIYEKTWTEGNRGYWVAGKRGYMSMAMHSYALAKLAHMRGEIRPAWVKHLRPDVRAEFREFTRVLAGRSVITEDVEDDELRPPAFSSETDPEEVSEADPPLEPEELLARYAAGERDFRDRDFADIALLSVDLRDCDFSDSDFSGAMLDGANLSGCRMVGTVFRWASLGSANFTGCDLREADFRNTSLIGTNFTDTQRCPDTDFRDADVSLAVGATDLVAEPQRVEVETDPQESADRFGNALMYTGIVTLFTLIAFQYIAPEFGLEGEAKHAWTLIVCVLVLAYQIVKRRWR